MTEGITARTGRKLTFLPAFANPLTLETPLVNGKLTNFVKNQSVDQAKASSVASNLEEDWEDQQGDVIEDDFKPKVFADQTEQLKKNYPGITSLNNGAKTANEEQQERKGERLASQRAFQESMAAQARANYSLAVFDPSCTMDRTKNVRLNHYLSHASQPNLSAADLAEQRTKEAAQLPASPENFARLGEAAASEKLVKTDVMMITAAQERRMADMTSFAKQVPQLREQQAAWKKLQEDIKGKSPAEQEAIIMKSPFAEQYQKYKNPPPESTPRTGTSAAADLDNGQTPSKTSTTSFNTAANPELTQKPSAQIEVETVMAPLPTKLDLPAPK